MRRISFAVAVIGGIVIGLLGSQPLWGAAVAALLLFPIACGVALRGPRTGSEGHRAPQAPLAAVLIAGVAGGLLTILAIRLAIDAPDWINATSADCGGASTSTQRLVLWTGTVIFLVSALPVAATLVALGRGLGAAGPGAGSRSPLSFFPVAVAASGLALIAAAFVTNC
jgi:hypothetical protein